MGSDLTMQHQEIDIRPCGTARPYAFKISAATAYQLLQRFLVPDQIDVDFLKL